MPTVPATFSVPARRWRSWLPPWSCARSGVPRRIHSAPTPLGPSNLWAETATVSAPREATSTSRYGAAWTASTWRWIPRRARTRSAISRTGWIVPTSLLASITATSTVRSSRSSSRASGSTRPVASTGTQATSKPHFARCSAAWPTAWCSIELTTRRLPCALPAHAAPLTARLLASVPPDVKTTSRAVPPRQAASCSRDSSRAFRAARPRVWADDGFPKAPPRYGSIASSASGRSGVVAAWSR